MWRWRLGFFCLWIIKKLLLECRLLIFCSVYVYWSREECRVLDLELINFFIDFFRLFRDILCLVISLWVIWLIEYLFLLWCRIFLFSLFSNIIVWVVVVFEVFFWCRYLIFFFYLFSLDIIVCWCLLVMFLAWYISLKE